MREFSDDFANLGGLYEDDMDKGLEHYDRIPLLFGLSELEKRLAMPFMLNKNTLKYFNSHSKQCSS